MFFLDTVGQRVFNQQELHEAGTALQAEPARTQEAYDTRLTIARKEGVELDDNWGRNHFFDDSTQVALAVLRSGFLGPKSGLPRPDIRRFLTYNPLHHPMPAPRYFTYQGFEHPLPERFISYVNGMGTPLEGPIMSARSDAERLSRDHANNRKFRCVYNPTAGHEGDLDVYNQLNSPDPHPVYTRTAYLIAQQWIDLLSPPNNQNRVLQIAFSAGATQTRAALRLMSECNLYEYITRISIITLCPATFITPTIDDNELPEGIRVEVKNIFKLEDAWSSDLDKGNVDHYRGVNDELPSYIKRVEQQFQHPDGAFDHPHNLHCPDYAIKLQRYINRFLDDEHIYPPGHELRVEAQHL